MRRWQRDVLSHVLGRIKPMFFNQVWPEISVDFKELIQNQVEAGNNKSCFQMVLFEMWRYSIMFYAVHPGGDFNTWIKDVMGIS